MIYDIKFMTLFIIINITHSYKLHKPVLLNESINILITNKNGRYIDGTVGSGGHSQSILSSLSDQGSLICIDRDPEAVDFVQNLFGNRAITLLGNFGLLESLLSSNSLPIDDYSGILLDLGLSTHQLEESSRGFSYQYDGLLDMRMSNPLFDSKLDGKKLESSNTAKYIVNNWSEERLCTLFNEFGQESKSSIIAKYIINYRKIKPIETTFDLKSIILKALSGRKFDNFNMDSNNSLKHSRDKIPNKNFSILSRIFQSLRMAVNDELYFLERFLSIFPKLIGVNGRVVIISYHSLEDRMVKEYFRNLSENNMNWRIITKRCITPSTIEVINNPKCRSAKLRCIERLS